MPKQKVVKVEGAEFIVGTISMGQLKHLDQGEDFELSLIMLSLNAVPHAKKHTLEDVRTLCLDGFTVGVPLKMAALEVNGLLATGEAQAVATSTSDSSTAA